MVAICNMLKIVLRNKMLQKVTNDTDGEIRRIKTKAVKDRNLY